MKEDLLKSNLMKVIEFILEKKMNDNSEILDSLLIRFTNVKISLENKNIDELAMMIGKLNGCCRAYLDSYSDYNNEILDIMYEIEKYKV
ncbi:MAG: hypothetical protein JXR48_11120 [Candidatus Delongbacteria bacterium]|nr:hypothetical protein [Candidatus Delongbacteria bacterium]MBN2835503.1 hypothetical protein [Candidatus Delongbacteria bacterium]